MNCIKIVDRNGGFEEDVNHHGQTRRRRFRLREFRDRPYVSIPEVKIKQTIEKGPAYDLGVGARIPLARTVSFFSEMSYLVRKGWGKTIIQDMNLGISEEAIVVNLKTVFIKFGLKFYI